MYSEIIFKQKYTIGKIWESYFVETRAPERFSHEFWRSRTRHKQMQWLYYVIFFCGIDMYWQGIVGTITLPSSIALKFHIQYPMNWKPCNRHSLGHPHLRQRVEIDMTRFMCQQMFWLYQCPFISRILLKSHLLATKLTQCTPNSLTTYLWLARFCFGHHRYRYPGACWKGPT